MASSLPLQQCRYPAHFYRKFEQEVATMKPSAKLSRAVHISTFVVKLLLEALSTSASAHDGGGRTGNPDLGNGNGKSMEAMITLDSDSSDDTTFFDWTGEFDATYVLQNEVKATIERILQFAVDAKRVRGLGLDTKQFVAEFCLAIEFPPLEVLWLLDSKFKLMSISSYLMRLKPRAKLDFFSRQFTCFCFSPCLHSEATSARATEILNDVVRSVIICGYCNPVTEPCLQSLKTMSTNILTEITKKLIDDDQSSLNHKFLVALIQEASVVHSIKKKYFSEQLLFLLASPTSQTIMDTLQYQERIAAEDGNERKRSTITLFLGPPQTKYDVVEILRRAIRELSSLNWENVLHTITTWDKMCSPDSFEIFVLMKDLIRVLISVGLNEGKEDEIMVAFILARHCCLISPKSFSRYEKWFSAMFEHDNSVTSTPEKFTFFIEVMTKWIPVEPPTFLQVHVSYRPFIPTGCRALWMDYSALARARISEYNEVEAALEYEPNLKDPIQHEVEMAIKEFDTSGNIPKSLSQMLFFRKPYYINQFLPALIKQPTGAVHTDARLRLIESLNLDGKLPANIYAAYKSSLQK